MQNDSDAHTVLYHHPSPAKGVRSKWQKPSWAPTATTPNEDPEDSSTASWRRTRASDSAHARMVQHEEAPRLRPPQRRSRQQKWCWEWGTRCRDGARASVQSHAATTTARRRPSPWYRPTGAWQDPEACSLSTRAVRSAIRQWPRSLPMMSTPPGKGEVVWPSSLVSEHTEPRACSSAAPNGPLPQGSR